MKQDQLLSLWIGPDSQKIAHHYYSLAAEQFFQDDHDPVNHHCMWNFSDQYMNDKTPKMLIFDTESTHLVKLRKVNHKKLLKKMKETANNDYINHFNVSSYVPEEEEIEADPEAHLFQNWNSKESHYVLIDKNFNTQTDSFQFWEQAFKMRADDYEDRIRKRLESCDLLRLITFCADSQNAGFTNQLVYHLKDQCEKKPIIFTSISGKENNYLKESLLPLLGSVTEEVDFYVDIQNQKIQFGYFKEQGIMNHLSPVFDSLFTPFLLKNSSASEYLQRIVCGNRHLFNLAFTLPIIGQQSNLHPETNIFDYLNEQKPKTEQASNIQRINYSNNSFLNISKQHKNLGEEIKQKEMKLQVIQTKVKDFIAESYVLKGHFNDFEKTFKPRTQFLSIKYLEGIVANNLKNKLEYDDFYIKSYGQKVQNYSFHSVLFQHMNFGPSIRNYLRKNKYHGGHELVAEWHQKVLNLADCYSEEKVESD